MPSDRATEATPAIIRFGLSIELRDELRRIESEGVGEIEEFNDVDPPLAAFDSRNVGLPTI